jgi:hypothetical protein
LPLAEIWFCLVFWLGPKVCSVRWPGGECVEFLDRFWYALIPTRFATAVRQYYSLVRCRTRYSILPDGTKA